MCRIVSANKYVCWDDIENHFKADEECTLYGENTWLCYDVIRHAWQHGECLAIDGHPLCEGDFYQAAQRQCVNLAGVEYCPRAFGVQSPH